MAFIDCNFAKCALREITGRLSAKNGRLSKEGEIERLKQYNIVCREVRDLCFEPDFSTSQKKNDYLNRKVKELLSKFNARHWNKEQFIDTFSSKQWNKLPASKKKTHSLRDCKGCFADYPDISFPWRARAFKARNPLLQIGLPTATDEIISTASKKLSQDGISRLASHVYNNINTIFKNVTGKSFGEVLPQVKEADVQRKPSKAEKEKAVYLIRQKLKRKIEDNLHAVDQSRPYQHRESLSSYVHTTRNEYLVHRPTNVRRLNHSKQKRHSSKKPNYNLDNVIEELENVDISTPVNWEQLAKKHGVLSGNAGQTLKEHLADRSINTSIYRNTVIRRKNISFNRRCKRRLFGGKITMPTHLTKHKVRTAMKRKIADGQYDLGEPCLATEMKRPRLQDGVLTWERITVEGRKIPLVNIRERMLKEHEKLGIMKLTTDEEYASMDRDRLMAELQKIIQSFQPEHSNEELRNLLKKCQRSRCLKMWHDHSYIENHGHMLFVVSGMYDNAVYYSNEEYMAKFGRHVDVETIVEQPWIYILAMSGDSSSDQFSFVDARLSDLKDLNLEILSSSGIPIKDIMRFHHGDHPALQFEFGISQGGEYCCVGCSASCHMFGDIAHCLRRPVRSVEEICHIATEGPHGRVPGLRKPIRSLKKEELLEELNARDLPTTGNCAELRERLKDMRCGVESVPALFIHNPTMSLESINVSELEPVLTEALHDCKGHIENVITELESKEHSNIGVQEFKATLFGNQDKIRGKDYRRAAYLLPEYLVKNGAPERYIELARSLRDVCALLYMRSSQRTPQSVLRLYNQILIHAILTKEILGDPQKVSKRKMFGVYFHGLLHAALLNRILAPRSGNAEFQEAEFHALREISRRTSDHHADHVIPNMLIRRQAEKEAKRPIISYEMPEDTTKQTFGLNNSLIKRQWLVKYPTVIQAHCEQIADFLEFGPGVWWNTTESGAVEYFDQLEKSNTDPVPPGPELHHFRFSSQVKEKEQLKAKWEKIVSSNITLPLLKLRVYDPFGDLIRIDNVGHDHDEDPLTFKTSQTGHTADDEETGLEGVCVGCDITEAGLAAQSAETFTQEEHGHDGDCVSEPFTIITTATVVTAKRTVSSGSDPESNLPVAGVPFVTAKRTVSSGSDSESELPVASVPVMTAKRTVSSGNDSQFQRPAAGVSVSTANQGMKPRCVTSEGKLLKKLFGALPEILDLDTFRCKAMDKSNAQRDMYSKKYMDCLAFVQTKVLKLHSDTKKAVELCNGSTSRFPSPDKPQLLAKLRNSEILLKYWNWDIGVVV